MAFRAESFTGDFLGLDGGRVVPDDGLSETYLAVSFAQQMLLRLSLFFPSGAWDRGAFLLRMRSICAM